MKQTLMIALICVIALFVMGVGRSESKRALVNKADVIALANLLRMDLPADATCSTSGKSSYHLASIVLARGTNIKGQMPANVTVKYRYT
jgi:hypothetical protein